MNIEKRKVSQSKPLSTATKSAIAAALGMSASLTLSACDDSSSPTSGQVVEPIDSSSSEEPLGGDAAPEDVIPPDSSDSPETTSSSSQADAIPGTSSQVENVPSSSSQTIDIPLSQEPVSSSLMDAISSALESSSSAAEPTSSETIEPESSSSEPTEQEIKDACQGNPGGTPVDIGGHLYLCPDNGGGMLFSMISTFERTDIET